MKVGEVGEIWIPGALPMRWKLGGSWRNSAPEDRGRGCREMDEGSPKGDMLF